ncbi:MAG: FAD-dependent oxidoreductase [Acidimicrobiaceae bacterium]|nr:FAD-dependent oxidoreductase [Acidimicrobiaceae bacterium]
MLNDSDHIVIVGAGLAGWRFAEAIRREGFIGRLTLVGEEAHYPYDRPPLSKQVLLGRWDVGKVALATDELIEKYDVQLRLGERATALDVASTTVRVEGGSSIVGSHVVIATGTRARRLQYSAQRDLFTLRSRDDAVRLLEALEQLEPQSTVAVVGGGFIGAEVATALQARGLRPVVLEAAKRPLIAILGEQVSTWLERLANNAGIELRTEQKVSDIEKVEGGFRLHFENSLPLDSAIVIVAAGAVANVEWLANSGLTIDNGVVVSADLLATERIGAIGDVARFTWPNTAGEESVRIEHWQTANDHASSLARFWMTGAHTDGLMVPYFWSDQYGKKIQMLGHARPSDDVQLVSGSLDEAKWTAVYSRAGTVTGVVTLSHPRALMLSKKLLESTTTLENALVDAPWSN